MAEGALSIKLRCASWQQLATIYKRDLSRGTMFLRASNPPRIGPSVRIDLTLPSASVVTVTGVVPVVRPRTTTGPVAVATLNEGAEIATAEDELIRALVAEAESLKKLNPF